MADPSASNPHSTFDWEDACLDRHNGSLQEGMAEGREAGALAGFRDGQTLGQNKGLEFGLEVGFYKGVVKALKGSDQEFNDRIQKSIQKLEEAIGDFPPPDQVFSFSVMKMTEAFSNSQNADEGNDDSEDPSRFDILNKMQRIRARFKLLTVQLGKPQFSLRSALEDSSDGTGKQSSDDQQGW